VTRRYHDAIDVRRRDDVPAEFRWRGRRYSVRAVLAHWVESGGWWQWSGSTGVAGVDDRERETWRVEAVSPTSRTGTYDLCFDWSAGGWTLARTHD
jgi:hypothetical protein